MSRWLQIVQSWRAPLLSLRVELVKFPKFLYVTVYKGDEPVHKIAPFAFTSVIDRTNKIRDLITQDITYPYIRVDEERSWTVVRYIAKRIVQIDKSPTHNQT